MINYIWLDARRFVTYCYIFGVDCYKESHSDAQGSQVCGCKSASSSVNSHVFNTRLMDDSSRLTPMNTIFCSSVPGFASVVDGLYCPYTLKTRLVPEPTIKRYFGTVPYPSYKKQKVLCGRQNITRPRCSANRIITDFLSTRCKDHQCYLAGIHQATHACTHCHAFSGGSAVKIEQASRMLIWQTPIVMS